MADRLVATAGDTLVSPIPPVPSNELQSVRRIHSLRRFVLETFRGSTLRGAIMVLIVLVLAVGAPIFQLHDPQQQDLLHTTMSPVFTAGGSWIHPLGTDALGRDLWARIIWGLRTSLLVSIPAVCLGAGLGLWVGTLAGYFGGMVDTVLMRITDIQMAFPFIILAIAVLSVATPSPFVLIIVLSLSAWPLYAR